MAADLTAYVPRLLLEWDERFGSARHASIDGTLVFADVSGFTKLSEDLARVGGKVASEDMAGIIETLFNDLLRFVETDGGEMLKYGGDAVLLFFEGPEHACRAAAASFDMQRRLRSIGRVTASGVRARLRMSIGLHSGSFDFFAVGRLHRELLVAGPATSICAAMEAEADATEVLASSAAADAVGRTSFGAPKGSGHLLARRPKPKPVPPRRPSSASAGDFLCSTLQAHLGGTATAPEHRLATVAFVHIMGLDDLLERGLTAEATVGLDDALTAVQQAFADHGVTFLATDVATDGVKIMAAGGVPLTGEDDSGRMLLALRQVQGVPGLLPLRAGVNRGRVFAGDVGSGWRRTYTAMGDVTNTAARVMGKAAAGEILALESVLQHARTPFAVTQLNPFSAKGKAEPLTPFRVEDADSHMAVPRADLVGREAELEWLRTLAGEALEGRLRAAAVVGDPGLGKSTLVEALRASPATARFARWVTVRCTPYSTTVPFAGIRQAFQRLLDISHDESPVDALVARVPSMQASLPMLRAALGGGQSTGELPELGDAAGKARLLELFGEVMRHLVDGPTAIHLEDIHWLDDASQEAFDFCLSGVVERPVLVVITRRDAGKPVLGSVCENRELLPLGPEESSRLVRQLATRRLGPHELDQIVERAAGNPLYLTELGARSTSGDELPDTLEEAIAARIDRLPAPARTLLRVAAVVGAELPAGILDRLGADVDLAAWPDIADFFVEDGSGGHRFAHALERDAAYEGLSFRQRRAIHQRIGELLEGESVEPEHMAELLAHHFSAAGDWERTWRYSSIAGDRAQAAWATVAASRSYRRALDALPRANAVDPCELRHVLEQFGLACLKSSQFNDASRAFTRVRRLPGSGPADEARLALWQGCARQGLGQWRAAERWFRRCVDAGVPQSTGEAKWQVRSLAQLAGIYFNRGRVDTALAQARRAESLAEEFDDTAGRGHAAALIYLSMTRQLDPSRFFFRDLALRIFEQIDDPFAAAALLFNAGNDAEAYCAWDEAADFFHRAKTQANRSGAIFMAGAAVTSVANLLIEQGRLEEGERALQEGLHILRAVGDVAFVAAAEVIEARLLVRRGESGLAVTTLRNSSAVLRKTAGLSLALEAEVRLADALLVAGEPDAAGETAQDALRAAEREEAAPFVVPAAHRVIAVVEASTDAASAVEHLCAGLRRAERDGAAYEAARLLLTWQALAPSVGAPPDDSHERIARTLLQVGVVEPFVPSAT